MEVRPRAGSWAGSEGPFRCCLQASSTGKVRAGRNGQSVYGFRSGQEGGMGVGVGMKRLGTRPKCLQRTRALPHLGAGHSLRLCGYLTGKGLLLRGSLLLPGPGSVWGVLNTKAGLPGPCGALREGPAYL